MGVSRELSSDDLCDILLNQVVNSFTILEESIVFFVLEVLLEASLLKFLPEANIGVPEVFLLSVPLGDEGGEVLSSDSLESGELVVDGSNEGHSGQVVDGNQVLEVRLQHRSNSLVVLSMLGLLGLVVVGIVVRDGKGFTNHVRHAEMLQNFMGLRVGCHDVELNHCPEVWWASDSSPGSVAGVDLEVGAVRSEVETNGDHLEDSVDDGTQDFWLKEVDTS